MALHDYAVAILAHARPEQTIRCVDAVMEHKPKRMECVLIVNDMPFEAYDLVFTHIMDKYSESLFESDAPGTCPTVLNSDPPHNIAAGKNKALVYLLGREQKKGVFIVENDVEVISPKAFTAYIRAHEKFGLGHFNWAFHERPDHQPIGMVKGTSIDLFPNIGGGFQFFSTGVIARAGIMDQNFDNALEHCEHTHRISLLPEEPPFWQFADIRGSHQWIRDMDCPSENNTQADANRIRRATAYWRSKCEHFNVPFPLDQRLISASR